MMASWMRLSLLLCCLLPALQAIKFLQPILQTTKSPLPVSQEKNQYEIYVPQIVRPGHAFSVSFTTYAAKETPFRPEFGLKGVKGEVVAKKFQRIFTDRTYTLTLPAPKNITGSSLVFYACSTKGFVFNVSQSVTVNRKVHSLYIQTDKGLYKPGQKVLIRVIAFNPDLKAHTDEISVSIYDTAQNKIKEFKDKSDNGVISSYLQLSDPTPLGEWTIKAETSFVTVEQFFTVAEYVLPKFEVIVDVPSFYLVNLNNPHLQEEFRATVLATYTYGKPVEGVAEVELMLDISWFSEPLPTIKKVIELKNGKADVVVDFKELGNLIPIQWSADSLGYQTILVKANVTETLTGIILSGDNKVPCKTSLYKLEFVPSTSPNYKPGMNYEAYLRVLRVDGSQPHFCEITSLGFKRKYIDVTVTFNAPWNYRKPTPAKTSKFQLEMSKIGVAHLTFKAELDVDSISIEATFFDEVSNTTISQYQYLSKFETRDKEGIQLNVLNTDPIIKPGLDLTFEIVSLVPIKRYSLQAISKENVVQTFYHKASKESVVFFKSIRMTQALVTQLAPEARFVVSYKTSMGELIADSVALNVVDYMANKISLVFNKNVTEPGDARVVLNVKTGAESFVGFLAVDQSVLLLDEGNDITQDKVANELDTYNQVHFNPSRPMPLAVRCFRCGFWPIWRGGSNTDTILSNAGLFVMTNLYVKKNEYFSYLKRGGPMPMMRAMAMADGGEKGIAAAGSDSSPAVKVRKNFPETFIWTETLTDKFGRSCLNLTVPDTITTWVATAFSVSSKSGLGITDSPAKLGVIKPLFISLDLPYSVVRGEEFVLQVNVFNYVGKNLLAEVKLLASKYFKVIDCKTRAADSIEIVKMVDLEDNKGTAVFFWVVATSLGHIPIQVRALTGTHADAIKVTLLVKPEGQLQSYTASELIQLQAGSGYNFSFEVDLPPAKILVPGSVNIEVTLIGDIIGSALNNIQDLLKMPYGCGEQNLLSFAPDVYILHYLKTAGRLTAEIQTMAIDFITSGYQRQLTYQRSDGSFSAFGQSDQAGSTWLSAFTIKCFSQARDYIPIDDQKIEQTLSWIIKYQIEDGSFVEPPGGRVIHTNMQGGSSSGVALTAYVAISLLENKNNSVVSLDVMGASIKKAIEYLESSYPKYSSDAYALAIIAYALHKADSSKLADVLKILDKMAIDESGLRHWKSKENTPSDTWQSHYGHPATYDIELASYVLLIFAEQKDLGRALPVAKWLLTQRNAFGGFESTQDTVLGLDALASFAVLIAAPTKGSGISVSVKGDLDGKVHKFDLITKENALVLQSVQMAGETKAVMVSAKDAGVALVQLIVFYNVITGDKNNLLKLKHSTSKEETALALEINTSWAGKEVSGMVVIEVNLLTGYIVVNQEAIKKEIGKSFKKLESSPGKIAIYLDELYEENLKFSVLLQEFIPVSKVKPALVKIYRYYDPEYVASVFYSATDDASWEGACPLCCCEST